MSNRGRLKLKFGNWFNLTNERITKMNESEIHELFKLKLIKRQSKHEKTLDWQVINSTNGRNQTIEFKIEFKRPWEISARQPDRLQLELCGEHFDRQLQKKLNDKVDNKGCLVIQNDIPEQISATEGEKLRVLYVVIATFTYF